MTTKQLVPTLETCVRLKEAGWVKETYFVWMQFPTYLDGMPTGGYVYHVQQHSSHPMYPIISAPTLQELLEELPEIVQAQLPTKTITFRYDKTLWWLYANYPVNGIAPVQPQTYAHPNPAEAAALLWLELHKEVVV